MTDEVTKEFYDNDLKEFFEKFERKANLGYFDELHDVSTFALNGYDKHGLKLWLRLKGSVSNENYHQKMKVAIGPWGIGAEQAHMIIVILTYRYNINAGTRRCGEHDFGHLWLDIVDRIQNRVQ